MSGLSRRISFSSQVSPSFLFQLSSKQKPFSIFPESYGPVKSQVLEKLEFIFWFGFWEWITFWFVCLFLFSCKNFSLFFQRDFFQVFPRVSKKNLPNCLWLLTFLFQFCTEHIQKFHHFFLLSVERKPSERLPFLLLAT